jgi:HemY protein
MKTIRLILMLLVLIAAAGGFVWLALQPGEIAYRGGAVDVTMKPAAAAAIAVAAAVALMTVLWVLGWLWSLPGRMARASAEASTRKGLEAMGQALAAAEAGEPAEAQRTSQKALGYLGDRPAARLLAAVAAGRSGDSRTAERLFGELTETTGYEVAARRGLAELQLARGNRSAALTQAEAALLVSKKSQWPGEFLFRQRIEQGEWTEALAALDLIEKRGGVDGRILKRRRAAVLTAAAHRAEQQAERSAALEMALQATKLAPGFAPGVVMAARLSHVAGKDWQAAALIETAWESSPHPALALAYRDLKPDVSREEQSRWVKGLVARNKDHRESRLLQAQVALDCREVHEAIGHLDAVIAHQPSARAFSLRAAAARAGGDASGATRYLEQASAAPRDPDWSDLDPEGTAFAYTDADWAELVMSYGETGELVHPRHARGEPVRLTAALPEGSSQPVGDPHAPPRPDDPGISPLELLGRD